MNHLFVLIDGMTRDLLKVQRGNKSAAQRVRVSTIHLEKVAKNFRKESLLSEKGKRVKKRKKRKKALA